MCRCYRLCDNPYCVGVPDQGSCSSCWAFAVVGSVEGALFIRTGSLVPLSIQCLVDCAHS